MRYYQLLHRLPPEYGEKNEIKYNEIKIKYIVWFMKMDEKTLCWI